MHFNIWWNGFKCWVKIWQKNDMIFGLQKNTLKNEVQFADHALVFMLRGVAKKWKQPYAYYYCNGTTQTMQLVEYIRDVVKNVHETGLDIVATVCD